MLNYFLYVLQYILKFDVDFSSMLTVSTPIQIETRVNRISTKDKMDGILFSSVLVKLALLEHPNSKFSVKLLTQY